MSKTMDHKNEILNMDLTKYAIEQGYTSVVKGKLSSIWITLKNENTNDSIRIKQKPYPMLFNNNDEFLSQDRGNIINFVINRLNSGVNPTPRPEKKEFAIAFRTLKKELNILIQDDNDSWKKKINMASPKRSENQNILLKINNLQDKTPEVENYLTKKRDLSTQTINHPYFSGIIKASPMILPNKKVLFNTAFVKKDLLNKTQGFTTYYYSSKTDTHHKRINAKQNLPVHSNVFENTSNIFIAESPIDALSHLEIKKPKDAIYIMNEGGLSPDKLDFNYNLYQNLKSKPVTITSINDNDAAGYKFDINLAIHFNNKINPTKYIESQEKSNSIRFKINNTINLPIKALELKMKQYLESESKTKAYSSYINIGQTKDFTFIEIPNFKTDNTKHLKLHLKPLSSFIFQLANIPFKHQKPLLKDWNDELKALKKKEVKIETKKGLKI